MALKWNKVLKSVFIQYQDQVQTAPKRRKTHVNIHMSTIQNFNEESCEEKITLLSVTQHYFITLEYYSTRNRIVLILFLTSYKMPW